MSDDSGSKNCPSELLALPRDSPSIVEHGEAQTKPDSGACEPCGVDTAVSISRVYSHSSIGDPGDSGSISKSKYESDASFAVTFESVSSLLLLDLIAGDGDDNDVLLLLLLLVFILLDAIESRGCEFVVVILLILPFLLIHVFSVASTVSID